MDIVAALSETQRAAIEKARKHPASYAIRILVSPGPDARVLVVLGEAHVKLGPAEKLGQEVVNAFDVIGVEGFPKRRVLAGSALMVLVAWPRILLRIVSFGLIKGSTIDYALRRQTGHTARLEVGDPIPLSLHLGSLNLALFFACSFSALIAIYLPWRTSMVRSMTSVLVTVTNLLDLQMLALIPAFVLRKYAWSWLIHPCVSIISVRNRFMANGTARMLAAHPDCRTALTIMGRGHLTGYARELITKHGFRIVDRA